MALGSVSVRLAAIICSASVTRERRSLSRLPAVWAVAVWLVFIKKCRDDEVEGEEVLGVLAPQQRSHEEHEEDDEENLGDGSGGAGDDAEAEQAGDQRDDEEGDSV